jgi:hypothetical protein
MLVKMDSVRSNFSLLCLMVIFFVIFFVQPISSASNNRDVKSHLTLFVMPSKQQLNVNVNNDLDVAESGGLGGLTGGLGGGAIKKVRYKNELLLFGAESKPAKIANKTMMRFTLLLCQPFLCLLTLSA